MLNKLRCKLWNIPDFFQSNITDNLTGGQLGRTFEFDLCGRWTSTATQGRAQPDRDQSWPHVSDFKTVVHPNEISSAVETATQNDDTDHQYWNTCYEPGVVLERYLLQHLIVYNPFKNPTPRCHHEFHFLTGETRLINGK